MLQDTLCQNKSNYLSRYAKIMFVKCVVTVIKRLLMYKLIKLSILKTILDGWLQIARLRVNRIRLILLSVMFFNVVLR